MDFIGAYDVLLKHGHVQDQYSFDRWLGKSCGYLAYLRTTGCRASVDSLMKLYFKLLAADKAHAIYGVDTGELRTLAESVMDEVEYRCG